MTDPVNLVRKDNFDLLANTIKTSLDITSDNSYTKITVSGDFREEFVELIVDFINDLKE